MRVNESDLAWTDLDQQGTRVRRKQLGEAAGGEELGCSLYELPAGERGAHWVVNDDVGYWHGEDDTEGDRAP